MHAHGGGGLQPLNQSDGLGGVDGVIAADGNQHQVEALQLLHHLRARLAAQIAQMRDAKPVALDQEDHVPAALRTLRVVVVGGQTRDVQAAEVELADAVEHGGVAGQRLNEIVVAVAVADQRRVGARRAERIAHVLVEGIGHQRRAVGKGHAEAGMAVPFQFHA